MKAFSVPFRPAGRFHLAAFAVVVFAIAAFGTYRASAQKGDAAADTIKQSTTPRLRMLPKRRGKGKTLSQAILKPWLREENSLNSTVPSVTE